MCSMKCVKRPRCLWQHLFAKFWYINGACRRSVKIRRVKKFVFVYFQVMAGPVRNQLHPYSIEALIGETDDTTPSADATASAVVTSAYSSQLSYWCHVCNALCMDAEDAKNHVDLHHHQRAQCNLRKSLFGIHGYISKHTKLNEERVECGICGKVVAPCFFSRHQRLHNGHVCDICYKEFSSNSRLKDHMNVHSNTTPFKCMICGRRFAQRTSLTQHYRYHRNDDSFICAYCNKSFNSKYNKTVHERLHTGDNPYKCTVPGCSRAYPQKIQLQFHMTSHRG